MAGDRAADFYGYVVTFVALFVLVFVFVLVAASCSASSEYSSYDSNSSSSSSSYSSDYSSNYSSDYDSSYTPRSSAGTWGDGYDHILNDSDPDPWDGYGYDSPSVSEDEAYIDKINGEWVFIH